MQLSPSTCSKIRIHPIRAKFRGGKKKPCFCISNSLVPPYIYIFDTEKDFREKEKEREKKKSERVRNERE